MKVKELIAFLENYDENAELEIEVYGPASSESVDSTFDIGIGKESSHPVLTISRRIQHSSFAQTGGYGQAGTLPRTPEFSCVDISGSSIEFMISAT